MMRRLCLGLLQPRELWTSHLRWAADNQGPSGRPEGREGRTWHRSGPGGKRDSAPGGPGPPRTPGSSERQAGGGNGALSATATSCRLSHVADTGGRGWGPRAEGSGRPRSPIRALVRSGARAPQWGDVTLVTPQELLQYPAQREWGRVNSGTPAPAGESSTLPAPRSSTKRIAFNCVYFLNLLVFVLSILK